MSPRIPLSIVTPERPTWEGEVDSLVVPAFEGSLGILPGHTPLLAQLVPGTVRMKQGESDVLLAVSGGFIEVADRKVAIFAETAEAAEEIDAERARLAAERARTALKSKGPEAQFDAVAQAALERALVRLRVSEMGIRRKPSPRQPS